MASTCRRNLQYAAPHWLRSVRAGLTLLLVSLGSLAGMWVLWFVLFLGEIDLHGEPTIAEALLWPFLGLSLACAASGFVGVLLVSCRDPGDRQTRRGLNSRNVSVVLGASSGITGALTFVPGLLTGRTGPLVLIALALSLSGLSISAIPTLATLVRRSTVKKRISPGALVVFVAGTEVLLFVYVALLALFGPTSSASNYIGVLFVVLLIAIPASALLYLLFLWHVFHCVRAAIAAQGRLPTGAGPEA